MSTLGADEHGFDTIVGITHRPGVSFHIEESAAVLGKPARAGAPGVGIDRYSHDVKRMVTLVKEARLQYGADAKCTVICPNSTAEAVAVHRQLEDALGESIALVHSGGAAAGAVREARAGASCSSRAGPGRRVLRWSPGQAAGRPGRRPQAAGNNRAPPAGERGRGAQGKRARGAQGERSCEGARPRAGCRSCN